MIDFTTLLYQIEIFLCISIFGLFLWWTIYKWRWCHKVPSPMYLAVMFFFLFQAWAMSVGLYGREMRDINTWELTPFMKSSWWHTRVIGRLMAEFMIGFIQSRIIYLEFFRDKEIPKRRKGDKINDQIG